jgi:hypothetical protein
MPAAAIKTAVRVLVISHEPDSEPYAIIPLHGKYGQGKVAKVSLEDVARVRRFRWYGNPGGYVIKYEQLPGNKFRCVLMHRFILDAPHGVLVDHRYHDKLDNRRSMIRLADTFQNARNKRKRKGSKIPYIGVARSWSKWRATIKIDDETYSLGNFHTPEEAALVYDACCRYHFGEFALCNFDGDEKYSVTEARARADKRRLEEKSSKYVGLTWFSQISRWHAGIRYGGIDYSLGTYDNEVDAAKAYDACARYFYGAAAHTNFLQGESRSPAKQRRLSLQNHRATGRKTSSYNGVWRSRDKWAAAVYINSVQKVIGYFATEVEAAKAYDACMRFYHPVGSFTNFEGTEKQSIEFFRRRKTRPSVSRFRGVRWFKRGRCWHAKFAINNYRKHLGTFRTEEEAARAYDDARAAHGLPRVNFPDQLQAA